MTEQGENLQSESTQTRPTHEYVEVRNGDDLILEYDVGLRGTTRAVVMDCEGDAIGSFRADGFNADQCREVARIIWRTHETSFLWGKDAGAANKARELRRVLGVDT